MTRPEKRYRVSLKVYLDWQDRKGIVRRCSARCVDVSDSGARIETLDELPPQSSVIVYSEKFVRLGHATVRYCRRYAMKYAVGLEFSTLLALSDSMRQDAVESATVRTI